MSSYSLQSILWDRGVKRLLLGYNALGDAGAKAMGTLLRDNKVLETLDLSNNNIKEEGGKALAQGRRSIILLV